MAIIRNTLYITYCVDVVYARRKQRPTTCICYIGLRGLYLDFETDIFQRSWFR